MKKSLVLSAAMFSMAVSGVALAKKGGKDAMFNCKTGEESVEIEGKTSFNNKEKKKFAKECKAKSGKWVKEDAAATAAPAGAAPAETTPGME